MRLEPICSWAHRELQQRFQSEQYLFGELIDRSGSMIMLGKQAAISDHDFRPILATTKHYGCEELF